MYNIDVSNKNQIIYLKIKNKIQSKFVKKWKINIIKQQIKLTT